MTDEYRIRIEGQLDASWASWFDGMTICHESDGNCVLCGQLADQAALHGVLAKIRDLGLTLVAIQRTTPGTEDRAQG